MVSSPPTTTTTTLSVGPAFARSEEIQMKVALPQSTSLPVERLIPSDPQNKNFVKTFVKEWLERERKERENHLYCKVEGGRYHTLVAINK